MKWINSVAAAVLAVAWAWAAGGAEVKLSAEQQEAAAKLRAKGVSVLQVAADTEALTVNASLGGKAVTDEDVALVKALPKVVQLNLAATGVTDAGLAHVAGLTELTHLHLDRTAVTDAGMVHLKGLSKLVYLNLYGTAVTDAGLEPLKGLKELRRIYLWQTKVTEAGAAALKKGAPELVVNRGEELTIPPPAKPEQKKPEVAATSAKPINLSCPVSGKPVDATFTIAHEGKTVGFCCGNCRAAFEKEPAKFAAKIKADAPAAKPEEKKPEPKKDEPKKEDKAVAKAVNTKCPRTGTEAKAEFTVVHEGKTIAFCCATCQGKFKENPDKYLPKLVQDVK